MFILKSSKSYHNKFYEYVNATNTGKIEKFIRKFREESVEAIKTMSFFVKILSMIKLNPFLR